MKRIISMLLSLALIFSVVQICASAADVVTDVRDGNISIIVNTDRSAYTTAGTADIKVTVINNSNLEITNLYAAVTSKDYIRQSGIVYGSDPDFRKGESVSFEFKAIVNPDAANVDFFSKLILKLKSIFIFSKDFATYIPNGEKSKTETFTVSHGKYSPEFTVTVTYDLVADDIKMGSYPQSHVTDSALIADLNAMPLSWESFGYYDGTGRDYNGLMQPSDYMRYADVTFRGVKYRAITFDQYRAFSTCYPCTQDHTQGAQYGYGYESGKIYWFKFEPLNWRVVDPDTGLVMCDTIIDAQPFNSFVIEYADDLYGNPEMTTYSNNYNESDIREWLNNDFYNTAFSSAEKANIKATTFSTESIGTTLKKRGFERLDCPEATDRIFFLSFADLINPAYGFNPDYLAYDHASMLGGTDYAKCQGLYNFNASAEFKEGYRGCFSWWLRSAYVDSYCDCVSFHDGNANTSYSADDTFVGVVPAMCVTF